MRKFLLTTTLLFVLISCDKKYKFSIETPEKIKIDQKISVQIKEENNHPFEITSLKFDGQPIENPVDMDISNQRLGTHLIEAEVAYQGKTKTLLKTLTFYAAQPPKVFDYKIINVYPHNTDAYTQGLEFHNGYLYESTGQNGASSLRKVELKTGKVLQKIDIPRNYFAEGMTILNDKIYQLTWREGVGFVYNLADFKQLTTFPYEKSKEGWGLTHDNTKLIKTDGTEKIWFLNPVDQKEIGFIEAYTNEQSVSDLNELEYINGKVYANVYQKNIILILNPQNGAIEGIVDLNGLETEMKKTQNLVPQDEVLNGIAYDEITKRIFVTGKHWGKLFEIQIFEK